jgi:hypothetical protein
MSAAFPEHVEADGLSRRLGGEIESGSGECDRASSHAMYTGNSSGGGLCKVIERPIASEPFVVVQIVSVRENC